MKVVHVIPYYTPEVEFGGPPATVHELCRALGRAGVGVHVVTTAAAAREEVLDGVSVSRVRRRTRLGFGAAIDAVLDEQLRDANACHVHTLFNWTAWRAAARARRCGRPTVVSPRGMVEPAALAHHAARKRLAWRLFDRRVVAEAAAVVAATLEEADTLRTRGIGSVVLPNGIEIPAALPPQGRFRAARGIAPDAAVVVFLGRLHPIKRLDLLASAFLDIARRHSNAVLVVAGPDESDLRAGLRAQLTPVADRVHWVGAVNDTEKWQMLTDCDLLVLCSDSESYGRVVAEGLAVGLPAIVTQTCPWHVVEREGLGRWVPQTAQAIAGAIDELVSDFALRRAMSARARPYAVEHFGWDRIVSQYIALYEAVAAPSRADAIAAQAGF